MTATPVELYVPCDVLTVKVRVGAADGISPLEQCFLRAVHAGVDHFTDLAELFGLGQRPTLDLIYDMWKRGHLLIDTVRAAVELTPDTRAKVADGRWTELAGGELVDEVRELLRNRLTGHVLPVTAATRLRSDDRRGVVPDVFLGAGDVRIDQADLLGILQRLAERDDERPGRPKRILAAHLSFTDLGQAPAQRWVRLTVLPTIDPATEALTLRLAGDPPLPPAGRKEAVERLGRHAEEQPDSPFVSYLREHAPTAVPVTPDFDTLLRDLEADVAAIGGLDDGLHGQWHERLCEQADAVEEAIDGRQQAVTGVRCLVGHAAHAAALREMMEGAQRQLVLACPWARYDAVADLLPDLRGALARDVQVFVLWGIRPDDTLDPQVQNLLTGLRREFPHLVYVSARSSGTHAKVAVCDDRAALVSGFNFLSPSQEGVAEVGVLLRAADGRACPPIERLLGWARSEFPEYTPAQLMFGRAADFPFGAEAGAAAPPDRPSPPDVGEPSGGAADLAPVAVRLWQADWEYYCRAGRRAGTPAGTQVRVLQDGQHREVLWEALRTARRRLLITSDQLGPEVVDARFAAALGERLRAGVRVALIHRRPTLAAGGGNTDALLAELAAGHPGQFRRLPDAPTHAKVLVYDDVSVVSSFNFLSFQGDYGGGRVASRKPRTEIGVLLTGAGAANQVVGELRAMYPDLLADWPAESPAAGPPAPPLPPRADLQAVLRQVAAADDPTAAAQALREAVAGRDPWPLVERLNAAGLPARLLRVAAAAAAVRDVDPAMRGRWVSRLAAEAWADGRFVEAAALSGDTPTPDVPHRAALLAAGWSVDRLEPALLEVVAGDGLDPPEAVALAAVGFAETALRRYTQDVWDQARAAAGGLPPAWGRAVAAFRAYLEGAYQPLPLALIKTDLAAADIRVKRQTAWNDLVEALDHARETGFTFGAGIDTHEYLFRSTGPFGRLTAAADGRDYGAVGEWLANKAVHDMDRFLTAMTFAATQDRNAYIGPPKRAPYVARLTAVVTAAEAVTELSPGPGESSDADNLLPAARTFAAALRREWPALLAEAESAGPARPVLRSVGRAFESVAEWGAT